jgi:hypothetical protein
LNQNLRTINYENNPIFGIIDSYDKLVIRQKVKILNQFCYLYYCLKFKKQLRDWLWIKVREPRIRERFHYKYLIENLADEETDLDEVLDKWINEKRFTLYNGIKT